MHCLHQASNQPLDVAAEVGLQWRPVLQTDAMLLTTTLQSARMKLLRVVEMNHCGQAADRPFGNYPEMAKVLLLRQHGVRKREATDVEEG